ncbi:DNA repair protein RadC [Acidisoma cellulosilytica]|uniref:DNA repair protein RadC n=1 Tax=Acidisoma cellulosilyticum TaxID=2802395 RepID=A0A963Z6L3_9PROT|nr:DNA repair protein RadC [Acidisoma cellulosilyticum]MCB8882822.1 DNA repair protein RadC [Acidisoma cellulosilyticum]
MAKQSQLADEPGLFGSVPLDNNETSPAVPGAEGHRARMRDRLLRAGHEALADHELLEMLLFLGLPRRDTKPIARALVRRFRSFANAIAATPQELREIEGLGESGIAALKTAQAAAIRLIRAEVLDQPILATWDRIIDYLIAVMAREKVEHFRVLYVDTKNRLIADEAQSRGTVNVTSVYPREIMRRALELNASAVILAHNHPSGNPAPSRQDIDMTHAIQAAAAPLSIRLHDHIIIGNGQWVSLRKEGLF